MLNAKLRQARDLMLQKRWDEARDILIELDDPIAREWLTTVEQMRMRNRSATQPIRPRDVRQEAPVSESSPPESEISVEATPEPEPPESEIDEKPQILLEPDEAAIVDRAEAVEVAEEVTLFPEEPAGTLTPVDEVPEESGEELPTAATEPHEEIAPEEESAPPVLEEYDIIPQDALAPDLDKAPVIMEHENLDEASETSEHASEPVSDTELQEPDFIESEIDDEPQPGTLDAIWGTTPSVDIEPPPPPRVLEPSPRAPSFEREDDAKVDDESLSVYMPPEQRARFKTEHSRQEPAPSPDQDLRFEKADTQLSVPGRRDPDIIRAADLDDYLANRPAPKIVEANPADFAPEPQPELPAGKPSNPMLLAFLSFILTPIISSLLLAFNWRRLGRGGLVVPTLVFMLLVMGIAGGAAAYLILNYPVPADWQLDIPVALGAMLGYAISYPYGIALAQTAAYRRWRSDNDVRGMLNRRPRFFISMVVTVLLTWVGGMAGGMLYLSLFTPMNYEDERLSLDFPQQWVMVDPDNVAQCQTEDLRCLLILRRDNVDFFLREFDLSREATPDEVEQVFWQSMEQMDGVRLISRTERVIDGQEAVERLISQVDAETDERIYAQQIYIVDGMTVLEISALSTGEAAFNRNRNAVEDLIEAIDFKANN